MFLLTIIIFKAFFLLTHLRYFHYAGIYLVMGGGGGSSPPAQNTTAFPTPKKGKDKERNRRERERERLPSHLYTTIMSMNE